MRGHAPQVSRECSACCAAGRHMEPHTMQCAALWTCSAAMTGEIDLDQLSMPSCVSTDVGLRSTPPGSRLPKGEGLTSRPCRARVAARRGHASRVLGCAGRRAAWSHTIRGCRYGTATRHRSPSAWPCAPAPPRSPPRASPCAAQPQPPPPPPDHPICACPIQTAACAPPCAAARSANAAARRWTPRATPFRAFAAPSTPARPRRWCEDSACLDGSRWCEDSRSARPEIDVSRIAGSGDDAHFIRRGTSPRGRRRIHVQPRQGHEAKSGTIAVARAIGARAGAAAPPLLRTRAAAPPPRRARPAAGRVGRHAPARLWCVGHKGG